MLSAIGAAAGLHERVSFLLTVTYVFVFCLSRSFGVRVNPRMVWKAEHFLSPAVLRLSNHR